MARVLFLTHHFPLPNEAGTGRPYETAVFLAELGYEVQVFTANMHYMTGHKVIACSKLYAEEWVGRLRVLRIGTPLNYRSGAVPRLWNHAAYAVLVFCKALFTPADVVFSAMDPVVLTPVCWVLSVLKRARLVVDERDIWPDTAIALGYLKSRPLIRLMDAWQGFVRRRARKIVAATPGI